MLTLTLKPGHDRRVSHGHPWVFSNELDFPPELRQAQPGTLARLYKAEGAPVAIGYFNPRSLIAFRVLSRTADRRIDEAFFVERLQRALALRERVFDEPFYRLVHSEGDGLPGLVIDRFDDTLVCQLSTAGMEQLADPLLAALEKVVGPAHVLFRNDGRTRELEGLPQSVHVAKGNPPHHVTVRENGAVFFANPHEGQKTGWYFDQRRNRADVAALCRGQRMLDVFTHTGGFGVTAAVAGASRVVCVDSSADALHLAKKAAEASGVGAKVSTREGDAFDVVSALIAEGEVFDVVVADPPAFVPSAKHLPTGLKAYQKLARLCAQLVAPGGFFFIASCSHNVPKEEFVKATSIGIAKAGRSGRLLRQSGADVDHPQHLFLPENDYLKGVLYQVDGPLGA
jgi:23S rRNA (cytosine1962-C5)-methyltransferase